MHATSGICTLATQATCPETKYWTRKMQDRIKDDVDFIDTNTYTDIDTYKDTETEGLLHDPVALLHG